MQNGFIFFYYYYYFLFFSQTSAPLPPFFPCRSLGIQQLPGQCTVWCWWPQTLQNWQHVSRCLLLRWSYTFHWKRFWSPVHDLHQVMLRLKWWGCCFKENTVGTPYLSSPHKVSISKDTNQVSVGFVLCLRGRSSLWTCLASHQSWTSPLTMVPLPLLPEVSTLQKPRDIWEREEHSGGSAVRWPWGNNCAFAMHIHNIIIICLIRQDWRQSREGKNTRDVGSWCKKLTVGNLSSLSTWRKFKAAGESKTQAK